MMMRMELRTASGGHVAARVPKRTDPTTEERLPERRFNGFAWRYLSDDATPTEQYRTEGRWFDGVAWRYDPPPPEAA